MLPELGFSNSPVSSSKMTLVKRNLCGAILWVHVRTHQERACDMQSSVERRNLDESTPAPE